MIGAIIAKRKVAKGFDIFNNRDLDGYLRDWREDATLVYPGDIPAVSGIHTGKAAIREFYERDFDQFPTLKITLRDVAISNLFDMVGNNVIVLHWEADATNREGYRIQNSGVNILKVKGGKVIHLHTYIFNTGKEFQTAWGQE